MTLATAIAVGPDRQVKASGSPARHLRLSTKCCQLFVGNTGLLDPDNMHAGDPLMDFVRIDAFSMHGDATKLAGLLSGYGICVPGQQPGQWPQSWRSRLPLYRIALGLELYNWFTIIGETSHLPALDRELRELPGEAAAEH